MARNNLYEEASSEDSFLDVVANVVGVLIIMVMIVGAQASRQVISTSADSAQAEVPVVTPPTKASVDTDTLRDQLEQVNLEMRESQNRLQDSLKRITLISHEAQAYDDRRVELAMHRATLQADLERRKNMLAAEDQQEFEVQRQILESKLDLEKLTQEQMSLLSAPETVEEIECVPTPLARTIEDRAIHLRLSKGLVSVVPLEELLDMVRSDLEGLRQRLQQSGRLVETFGPLDGYRLKFTVAEKVTAESLGGPLAGQIRKTSYHQYAEIIPVSESLGQNVEQALLPGGTLRRLLESQRRHTPNVEVWLYTDSFDEFRPLKRTLWELGFAVSVRPMRPGTHIGASPEGTRGSAQ